MKAYSGRTKEKYELLIGPLRERARELGYAVAVHGSLARDIDLVAVPWSEGAVAAESLAEELRLVAERENGGIAFLAPHDAANFPRRKPHGRLCWSYHLGGGPYIDLSVLPPVKPESTERNEV